MSCASVCWWVVADNMGEHPTSMPASALCRNCKSAGHSARPPPAAACSATPCPLRCLFPQVGALAAAAAVLTCFIFSKDLVVFLEAPVAAQVGAAPAAPVRAWWVACCALPLAGLCRLAAQRRQPVARRCSPAALASVDLSAKVSPGLPLGPPPCRACASCSCRPASSSSPRSRCSRWPSQAG